LHNRCSNNQAEQLAIQKALEEIYQLTQIENKLAAIYTDSQMTIDSLKNARNHKYIIENIRSQLRVLEKDNWMINFRWVKGHTGIYGNEIADRLAKEAAEKKTIIYSKVLKNIIKSEIRKTNIEKWQREWDTSIKGQETKNFFQTLSIDLKGKS
jgi:ribonuclease HI